MQKRSHEPSPAYGTWTALTPREKQRGAIVFAGLIVASLLVKSVWQYSGGVAPPVVHSSSPFHRVYSDAVDERGDPDAMYLLAEMYIAGALVPQDLVEAQKWCRLSTIREPLKPSAFRQSKTGQSARDRRWSNYYASQCGTLEQALSPQQLADAANRASEWLVAFEQRSTGKN